jgi:hypothetical protein
MGQKLAVMLVHGILNNDEQHFADTSIRLLKSAFKASSGVNPDDALAIRTVNWGQVAQPYEDRLLARLGDGHGSRFYEWLDRQATNIDGGSVGALVGAALSGFARVLPGGPKLHYPTLRWLLSQYIGDAIAYQITPRDRRLYDQVHAVMARTLSGLATEAGPDAPMCVIAHSLGTVIASDYFYDLEVDGGVYGRAPEAKPLVAASVRQEIGDTPLERGETLAFLYTLGSPLALWTLRFSSPELDRPLVVPHPHFASDHPQLGGWVNIYDPDDVVASALSQLSKDYASAVRDEPRSVGPPLLGAGPLAHLGYWNDRAVMNSIGRALAQTWNARRSRSRPKVQASE